MLPSPGGSLKVRPTLRSDGEDKKEFQSLYSVLRTEIEEKEPHLFQVVT